MKTINGENKHDILKSYAEGDVSACVRDYIFKCIIDTQAYTQMRYNSSHTKALHNKTIHSEYLIQWQHQDG